MTKAATKDAPEQALAVPLLVLALALAVAMLACFIHLINVQMMRGEQMRQAQRDGVVELYAVGRADARPLRPAVESGTAVRAVQTSAAAVAMQRVAKVPN
jgi:hypothetical protein